MFVKICGVTTEEDALLSVAMGADALGFNFVPGSVRLITPTAARDIVRRLPAGVMSVGVFRNELPQRVVEIVNTVGLQAAQLHGNEGARDSSWIAERLDTVIKVFAAGDPALDRLADYGAKLVLVDAPEGGSGKVFDWSVLDGRQRGLPLILAGGLRPDNVGRAIASVRPWGVDVATGVESAPGRKDPTKVREFIANARAAGAAEEPDTAPFDLDGPAPYDWRDE
ncbi:MAG: phosphoribosylanthranilate isomerase [Actinomycetota bacterium]|jgi:phosphoribosylanthranilate isomerase|nr:phosphoribosylanthranilate isomerase [Actinomycetota bacterium]